MRGLNHGIAEDGRSEVTFVQLLLRAGERFSGAKAVVEKKAFG